MKSVSSTVTHGSTYVTSVSLLSQNHLGGWGTEADVLCLHVSFWQLRYDRGNLLKYHFNQPVQWEQIFSVITDASDSMLPEGEETAYHTPQFHILSYILALAWVFNIHWLAIPSL